MVYIYGHREYNICVWVERLKHRYCIQDKSILICEWLFIIPLGRIWLVNVFLYSSELDILVVLSLFK